MAKVTGTTKQPAPTESARSRDVLPRAMIDAKYGGSDVVEMLLAMLSETCGITDVAAALDARANEGVKKYGVPLRTHNGRNAREALAQELLDAFMCATQLQMEEEDAE